MQLTKTRWWVLSILKLLGTDSVIVVLTDIGSRNIDLVRPPWTTMTLTMSHPLISTVLVLDNIVVEKTCLCPKCDIESLFLNLSYTNESSVLGGIYCHPNAMIFSHFVNNLENTLIKLITKQPLSSQVIWISRTIVQLTAWLLFSQIKSYLLHVLLTSFNIFVRFAKHHKSQRNQIMWDIFY